MKSKSQKSIFNSDFRNEELPWILQKNSNIEIQDRALLKTNKEVARFQKRSFSQKVFKNSAAVTINMIIDMDKLKKRRQPSVLDD